MNPPSHPPDPLLQRYQEANALDPARPDPAVRARVLEQARAQAVLQTQQPAPPVTREAANDRVWTLSALGSLAVLGLVGLLALQFDRSPSEERAVALGSKPLAPLNVPEAGPAAPTIAPQADTSATASTAASTAAAVAASSAEPVAKPLPALPATQAASPATADQAPQPPLALTPPPPPSPPAPASPAQADGIAVEARPAAAAPARAETPTPMAEPASPSAAQAPAHAADAAEAATTAPSTQGQPAARMTTPMGAPLAAPIGRSSAAKNLGQTPLMRAAARGDAALVEQLLDAGADLSQRDQRGWTAADHARHAGHEALAQRLAPPSTPPDDQPR